MNLFLEKRADGTYYFRQTKIINDRQIAKRISLKTRHYRTARMLAIQLIAGMQMDKIRKFEHEQDASGNTTKLKIEDEADLANFRAAMEVLERNKESAHRREMEKREVPAFTNTTVTAEPPAKTELRNQLMQQLQNNPLKDYYKTYMSHCKVRASALGRYRRTITKFLNFCDSRSVTEPTDITRLFVLDYIKYLREVEKKDDKTISGLLTPVGTFYIFLYKAEIVSRLNPFADPDLDFETIKRLPWTNQELEAIFTGSFVKDQKQNFYILLILLTSGARPNEICQLMSHDIRWVMDEETENGLWIIDITDDPKFDQVLKNKVSKRKIYLHDLLIKHGFLDYLATRKGKRLWDLTRPTNSNYADFFSRDFSAYLRDDLKIEDKVLYCFRHTVTRRLKIERVPQMFTDDLVGHTSPGEDAKSYNDKYTAWALKEVTEPLLAYPKIQALKIP